MEKPKVIAVIPEEGGPYLPWPLWQKRFRGAYKNLFHALVYEDGSIWDCVNGWRKERDDNTRI
jgi:hypothetical protein